MVLTPKFGAIVGYFQGAGWDLQTQKLMFQPIPQVVSSLSQDVESGLHVDYVGNSPKGRIQCRCQNIRA